jgi:hypothetical protein
VRNFLFMAASLTQIVGGLIALIYLRRLRLELTGILAAIKGDREATKGGA